MKLNKIAISALGAIITIMGIMSCSSDDYVSTEIPNGAQIYFANDKSSEYFLEENQNSVQVAVNRVNTDGVLTVKVAATQKENIFTVAETLTFDDGEDVAYIPVTFNFSDLEPDTDYELNLSLLSETSAYGDSEATIIIKYAPWTEWEPLGWKYPSNISTFNEWEEVYANAEDYSEIVDGDEDDLPTYTYTQYLSGTYSQPIFVRSSILNPENAQLMLYDWFYGVELIINWNKETNDFSVSNQWTGYNHSTYGQVYTADAFTYFGGDKDRDGNLLIPCTYDKENGLFTLNLIYFVSVGYFGFGPEYIQLPGYEKPDYSLDITDNGAFQNDSQLGEVFNFTLGEDLGKIQYAVFEGTLTDDEIDEKAEGIFSGEIASTTTTENGTKVIFVQAEGDHTIVFVLYDADGNRVGNESYSFAVIPPTPNAWKSLGTGYFTDNLVLPMYYEDEIELVAYEVEIQENTNEPGMYRIVNAFESVTKYLDVDYTPASINVNAVDADGVYILPQSTGIDDGDGLISIATYGGYMLQRYDFETLKSYGYFGKMNDGIIKFPYLNSDYGPFQGLFIQGGSAYYAGMYGDLKIVLPTASKSAIAKAKSLSKATSFANRMNAYKRASKKNFTLKEKLNTAKKALKTPKELKLRQL